MLQSLDFEKCVFVQVDAFGVGIWVVQGERNEERPLPQLKAPTQRNQVLNFGKGVPRYQMGTGEFKVPPAVPGFWSANRSQGLDLEGSKRVRWLMELRPSSFLYGREGEHHCWLPVRATIRSDRQHLVNVLLMYKHPYIHTNNSFWVKDPYLTPLLLSP